MSSPCLLSAMTSFGVHHRNRLDLPSGPPGSSPSVPQAFLFKALYTPFLLPHKDNPSHPWNRSLLGLPLVLWSQGTACVSFISEL